MTVSKNGYRGARGSESKMPRILHVFPPSVICNLLGLSFSHSACEMRLSSYWTPACASSSLENSALPIEDLEHPAITICGQGFNMQHVYDVMEKDFLEWVRRKNRTKR